MTTPGYKRRIAFSQFLTERNLTDGAPTVDLSTDFSSGKIVETGSPLDLAILGDGFFVVRDEVGRRLYTRQGQFSKAADGRLVTPSGLTLQGEGGGDLIVHGGAVAISGDGAVLEAGQPIGRVALALIPAGAERAEGGAFAIAEGEAEAVVTPALRQGAYEASNVSTADEMVAMMAALRRAESGQRLMTLYDDLMGRVLTTFGQS